MASSKADSDVRVRIAPSPTGYPHIGTIYQALFNWAFAKKNQGKFVVRIEDTDRSRFVKDAEEKLFNSLDWFALTEDESPRQGGDFGPYRQSERFEMYHKYAQELHDKGGAYFSYFPKEDEKKVDSASTKDSTEPANQEPNSVSEMLKLKDWVLRLKVPENKKIVVRDEIRGDIEFDSNEITDQVLLKSDGFPTYHLAVVVDDHLMKITDAVRGEEWITSFPKHKLIYDYLGWKMPRFYHTPVLRNPDRSKLSKRQGHTSAAWYQDNGYLREALLNFLALLGWSHPEEKEIFSLDEFTRLMDLKDIKPVGPIFNLEKLDWMNGEYIRALPEEELTQRLKDFDEKLAQIDDEKLKKFVNLAKTRMKHLNEFTNMVTPFFNPVEKKEEDKKGAKKALAEEFEKISDWTQDNIFSAIKKVLQDRQIRFPYLYRVLTGQKFGLPLADVFEILGKEKTIELLKEK